MDLTRKYFIEKNNEVKGFSDVTGSASGLFVPGKDGVKNIFSTDDKKIEIIQYENKALCCVNSAFSNPAIYPWIQPEKNKKIEAVLMDLDGTSVHSEHFWIWIIEQVMGKLTGNSDFSFESADEPYVAGHSVGEHLTYAINKYAPGADIEKAREYYYSITEYEMNEILEGRGKEGAFTPAPGLKNFLKSLKMNNIKIGLVTSGLYNKAMPEIISAFRTLGMGDPVEFYDAIITAGYLTKKGITGTLGELCLKPHPWLYSEVARVALGVKDDTKIIGIEDSCAGVMSLRLSGYNVIGLKSGNIFKGGFENLCIKTPSDLNESLEYILSI